MATSGSMLCLLYGLVTLSLALDPDFLNLQEMLNKQEFVSYKYSLENTSSQFDQVERTDKMLDSSADQGVMLRGSEVGRGYNLTCGPTCTYPILGIGALLVYSFFMREAPSRSRVDVDFTRDSQQAELSEDLFEFEGDLREKIKDEYRKAVTRERRIEREKARRRLQELKTGENHHGSHLCLTKFFYFFHILYFLPELYLANQSKRRKKGKHRKVVEFNDNHTLSSHCREGLWDDEFSWKPGKRSDEPSSGDTERH